MKQRITLLLFIFIQISFQAIAQNYNSLKDGNWTSSSTWKRQTICAAPSGWGSVEDTNHPSVPPTSSSWPDCEINVFISHHVTKGGKNTFSQKFKSLKISKSGKLTFSGKETIHLTNNSYDGVVLTVDGGILEVYDLEVSNGAKLKVINGGKVIVRNELQTGGNTSLIEVDAKSSIEVEKTLSLKGNNSSIVLAGTFSAKEISNTGGSTNHLEIKAGASGKIESLSLEGSSTTTIEGKLEVSKDFEIKGSSTLLVQKSGELKVKGDSEHKSSNPILLEGTATLTGKLELTGNSTLQVNGNLLVQGNTTLEGSSSIRIPGYATFEKDVNLKGGGTHLHVSGSGDVLIKGDLDKPKNSATISVLDKSALVICNDRVNGDKAGAFPPTTYSNMNIAPAPAYYGGCRILPVEFPVFNVALNQNFREVNVAWATAKEWNNSHFIIERAVDQVKNWEPVGEILGAGYSDRTLNYSFVDKDLPANGGQLFYRIRQVDFDGKSTIGNTKAVNLQPVSGKGTWTAYPNPSQQGTYVHIELLNKGNFNEETIAVQLSNPTGTSQENFLIKNPTDVEKVVNDFIATKNSGLYVLHIRWGEFSETIKILVQ